MPTGSSSSSWREGDLVAGCLWWSDGSWRPFVGRLTNDDWSGYWYVTVRIRLADGSLRQDPQYWCVYGGMLTPPSPDDIVDWLVAELQ